MSIIQRNSASAAALLILVTAACQEEPAGAVLLEPADPIPAVAQIRCDVNVRAGTLACAPAAGGTGAGALGALMTVGGQHQFIRLANSATTYDSDTGIFSTLVSVQNLLAASLATADGTTPSPTGVRVFFATGPSGSATVANADGTAMFTAADQPYFQYAGLNGDGILSPGEISEGRMWQFDTQGAGAFSFTVYVRAEVIPGAEYTRHYTQLALGDAHTCGLSGGGAVSCWGFDQAGNLGNGNAPPSLVPTPILTPAGAVFTRLAAHTHYACALTTDGRIYCWGYVPGEPHEKGSELAPVEVTRPAGVVFSEVAAGAGHVCALDDDGAAWCWGGNASGEMGNGTVNTPEQMTPGPVTMPPGVTFTALSAGDNHTCAVGSNQRAYCWGDGGFGQLGDGDGTDAYVPTLVDLPPFEVGWAAVSGGSINSCGMTLSGAAYCWGYDNMGQLGNGSDAGNPEFAPSPVDVPVGVTFTAISAGNRQSCALGSNGAAYCWGSDEYGKLGNGEAVTADQVSPSPIALPAGVQFTGIITRLTHSCAVSAGAAYCWGLNHFAGLGDGTDVDRSAPVAVAGSN